MTITQVMNTKEDTIIEQSITALKNMFLNGIEFYQKRTLIPLKLCFMYCQTMNLFAKNLTPKEFMLSFWSLSKYIYPLLLKLFLSLIYIFSRISTSFLTSQTKPHFFFFQALTVSSEYVHFLASKPMKAIFFFSRLDVCFLKRTLTLVSFFLLERLFSWKP